MDQEEADHKNRKPEDTYIRLDESNLHVYGYSLFCYPDEWEKIRKEGYRLVNLGPDSDGSNLTKILIPEKYLFLLSEEKERKLPNLADFEIESEDKDVQDLKRLSSRAGWNQTHLDFEILLRMADRSYFLAVFHYLGKKIPLGSGALLDTGGNISWISMVLVHKEVRRQGIAASIMFKCLRAARLTMKDWIVGLDATPAGSRLYEKLGFRKSFSIYRCLLPTGDRAYDRVDTSVVPLYQYNPVGAYLLKRGFEEKDFLYRSLFCISGGRCYVVRSGDGITGFVMSRPGAIKPYLGPLLADSERDAEMLLDKVRHEFKESGFDQLFCDVPVVKIFQHHEDINDGMADIDLPFEIENGLFKGATVLRKFDRMYQLIGDSDRHNFHEYIIKNFPQEKENRAMVENSARIYDLTMNFMEKEKNIMLTYQYGIGGPEYG